MVKIDVNKEYLSEVKIKEKTALFTELRVSKNSVPEGIYCYDLRYGDDDSFPSEMELNVIVNYFGAVLMTEEMKLDADGRVVLDKEDFGFTGEMLDIEEYMANYSETEPNYISTAQELLEYIKQNDCEIAISEEEADILLGYIAGHDYMLGSLQNHLYRGDLDYEIETVRWEKYSLDDVINIVCEWNYEMLEEARDDREHEKICRDEKILDAMFERTSYGKAIDEVAKVLVEELLQDINTKGGIDTAVECMLEKITDGQGASVDRNSIYNKNGVR